MTAVDYTYERRTVLSYNEGKEDGISISQIADELEESEDTIKELAKEIEE